MSAISYLRASFGNWMIPPMEEHSLVRTFRKYQPDEVLTAIERLKRIGNRPSPAEVESMILGMRGKPRIFDDAPLSKKIEEWGDVSPPDTVATEVERIREQMRELGIRA